MENRIGEAAGKVWHLLHVRKSVARTQLAKEAGLPADLANQAVGWLAREGNLAEEVRNGKVVLRLKR